MGKPCGSMKEYIHWLGSKLLLFIDHKQWDLCLASVELGA